MADDARWYIDDVLGGPAHIRAEVFYDNENVLDWVHIDRDEIARLKVGVPPQIFSRLGLDGFFAVNFVQADSVRACVSAVVEFCVNYDKDQHRSMVGGQHVDFSLEAIRGAFNLPVGRDMCPRLKQQQHFADWFDFYDTKRKAFWANLCLKPGWASAFELINALLLGRRFAKEIKGVLAWYVKSKVDPEGNPEHDDLDWASIIQKNWDTEILALRKHFRGTKTEGRWRSCLGQTLTHFLIWSGVIENPKAAAAAPAAVPAGAVPAGEGQSESESRDGQSREGEDESSAAETDDNEEENSVPGDNEVLLGHSDGDLSPSRARSIRVHEEAGPSSTKRRRRYLPGAADSLDSTDVDSDSSGDPCDSVGGEPSRHSTGQPMEVDGMTEITTSDPGSEFMIVPRRPGASLQSWGQPMEEVRPENTSNIEVQLQISPPREPSIQSLGQPMEEEVRPENTSNLEVHLKISPPRESGLLAIDPDEAAHVNELEGHFEAAVTLARLRINDVPESSDRPEQRSEPSSTHELMLVPADRNKRKYRNSSTDPDSEIWKKQNVGEDPSTSIPAADVGPDFTLIVDLGILNIAEASERTDEEKEKAAHEDEERKEVGGETSKLTEEEKKKAPEKACELCLHQMVKVSRENMIQLEKKMMAKINQKRQHAENLNTALEERAEKMEEEVTRLEKKLKPAVDSTAEKLRTKVEQHRASSSARGSVEPPLRSAAYYEEGERKYRQRLTEIQAEFTRSFNKHIAPWAVKLLKALHLCELDLHAAYRQTRMVHKERWIEFARYGSASYAMRNIPMPDLESIIVECRAEEFMKAIGMYKPLLCDNDDHDHIYEVVASGREESPVGASQPSALHPAVVSPDLNVQPSDEADASGTEEGPLGASQPSVLNLGVVSPDIIVQPMVAGHPSGQRPTSSSVPIREADQETVIATSTIIPTGEGSSQQIVWAVPGRREEYDRKPVFGPLTKHQIELSKGLEILMRFRRFGNIPPMQLERKCAKLTKAEAGLLQDLEELQPALDALKFLHHRHNELKAAVKTLNTEVQKLLRQKAAFAVEVRAAVSWEGEEEVLGVFAENEQLKKDKESLLEQLRKKGVRPALCELHWEDSWSRLTRYWSVPSKEDLDFMFSSLPRKQQSALHTEYWVKLGEARRQTVDDVEMVLQRGGEGDDQGEEDEPRGPGRTLVERPRYLADIEGRIEVLLEAARDAEMEEQRSDLQ
ncbi:hypothetical protein R1sor_014733 [Riccia sorocarpa]|uniref:Aminotransferase-like plant mobile domain-containing protein n=1 Tax=Riccia sorocarpa TaxID=122646 RepID=A0ABD3HD35_9MARC